MRAAIYARVSTTDQNCEMQIRELQAHAERQGWPIVETYQDIIISGAKASRPGLNRLMLDGRVRKFDCLRVWKLDRFGRSLVDCLNNIRTLEENGFGLSLSPRASIPTSGTRHPDSCSMFGARGGI